MISDLESISHSNWPDQNGEHKVIQIYISDRPYLRFREASIVNLHKALLRKSLDEFEIDYDLIATIEGNLPLSGNGYLVTGMGLAEVDLENKTARFYGNSTMYKIPIDSGHIERIKPLFPDWQMIIGEPETPRQTGGTWTRFF